jgi:hypothetical protein
MTYDPSLVQEPPGSGVDATATSPMQAAFDRALKASQNPFTRFAAGYRGQDPDAALAPLAQALMQEKRLTQQDRRLDQQAEQQEKAIQLQFLNVLSDGLGKLSTAEPDFRAQAMKLLGPSLMHTAKMLKLDLDPELLKFAGNVPNAAKDMVDLYANSELVSPEEREALVRRLSSVKGDTEKRVALDDFMDRKLKAITPQIERELPTAVARVKKELGLAPDQPIDEAAFTSNAPKFFPIAKDPLVGRAFAAIIKEKAAAYGITSAATAQKRQEESAKAQNKSLEDLLGTGGMSAAVQSDPEFAKVQQAFETREGRKAEPREVLMSLPATERQKYVQRAQDIIAARELKKARETGAEVVKARDEAEATLPLISSLPKGSIVRDRMSGDPVDVLQTSRKDLIAKGGGDRYVVFDEYQERAFQAVQESKVLLNRWVQATSKLTEVPGQNFAQAVEGYFKSALGIPNIKTELDALQGSILRFAGAIQGSRIQLSDQDRKSVEKMFSGILDTKPSGLLRLGVLNDIVTAMEDIQLGRRKPSELSDLIRKGATRIEKPPLTPVGR